MSMSSCLCVAVLDSMISNISANRLVILGYKRALVREDLWSLNAEDTSAAVKERYEKHWQAQVVKIKRLVVRFLQSFKSNLKTNLFCTAFTQD